MKKRIFAGALALLMIIGLLPVSSMVKKPMETKAEQSNSNIHVWSAEDKTIKNNITAGKRIDDISDDFFNCYAHKNSAISSVNLSWTDEYKATKALSLPNSIKKDSKGIYSAVGFNPKKAYVIVKLWLTSSNTTTSIGVYVCNEKGDIENVKSEKVGTAGATYHELIVNNNSKKEYYIGADNKNISICKIEVDEYDYKVAISDNGTDKTEYLNEGELVKLNASGSGDFAYWINSNGVIVGTKRTLEIPAYYDVTYTAVYNTAAKVDYLTSYGSVYKSFTLDELKEEPVGPTCYGYEFANWDMSLEDIKTKLNNNENVVVKPVYKSASNEYTITVDTTDLGGSRVTSTYGINTIVTATTSSNEFAYWVDASNNNAVLSYSSTYLFFANKDIEVKAVKGASGKDDNAKAVITNVSNTTVDNTNVAIFEYNIPADYQITFAGVVASKTLTGDNLTAENNGAHVIGDRNLSYTTYRYTLSATKGTTWHVRPMMKYTYGGTTYTIYGQEITMK